MTPKKKFLKKRIDQNCFELNFKFNNLFNGFFHIKSYLNISSSLLALDFSVLLSIQYTLKTLFLTQKHKKYTPKTYRPKL